jgi:predicted nucleic acid-binding protein
VAKAKAKYRNPYLDSSVFLAWVKGEQVEGIDRRAIADDILKAGRDGRLQVYTSTLTIAEVHKLRKGPVLPSEGADSLLSFFQSDFIRWVDVERRVAELAHRLCREHGIYPCDGIHLACALMAKCDVLLAWDGRFEKVNVPGIRVEEPQFAIGQRSLEDGAEPPEAIVETEGDAR